MYPNPGDNVSVSKANNSDELEAPDSKDELYKELYHDIIQSLTGLEYDVSARNSYMNRRYRAVYKDGVYQGIDIPAGEWFAEYNLVARVVDIMTTQLFGRGFNMVSTYSKEDVSVYQDDDPNKQAMQLKNKKLKADADLRMRVGRAIIKDNGGMAKFEDGGRVGSSMGMTAFKMYPDTKTKKIVISLLEKPQNLRFGWKGDNFREWDFAAYVYQISVDSANREYGHLLKPGETFQQSKLGLPLQNLGLIDTTTVYGQVAQGQPVETDRPMVTVVDFTGNLKGWATDGKSVKEVDIGKESPFSVLCVGGRVGDIVTNEEQLPKYYKIDNRWVPGQSWGDADISESLMDINKEIVRLMRDMGVWADKNLWKTLLAKGFTPEGIAVLKGKKRTTKVLTASPEQDLTEVGSTTQPLTEFAKLVDQKIDLFVRLAGVGRVLFDDPTVNANSNQALMTTLKSTVDLVESKQKRWNPELINMFTDALYMAAKFIPGLQEALDDDPDWEFLVEWPSVLRREDPAFQTMWLNFMNRGIVSAETFMQKALPVYDTEEEIDRIRDEMSDPIMAAIMGNQLGEVAHQTINKSLGIPPWGYVLPKVSLKGELAPQETGNMAHNFGWDQGPYGPDIGPTGYEGAQANANFDNAGFVKDTKDGPQPVYHGPQPANPQLTPDQNQGQTASQPGSGAPSVSPAGAVAQANQQAGH
jgi:hypothetical protein